MKNYTRYWGAALLVLLLFGSQESIGQTLSLVTPSARPAVAPSLTQQGQLLEAALERIKQEYQVKFGYDEALVQGKRITAEVSSDLSLEGQLQALLSPLGLQYKKLDDTHYVIQPKQKPTDELQKVRRQSLSTSTTGASASTTPTVLALASRSLSFIQAPVEKTITGTVTDGETGDALPGVNVLVKNTTVGTVTDIDGNYRLTVADDAETLVFSSVGYVSQEVAIGNQTTIDLAMAPDVQSLSEVVVVGYGTVQKKDLTGSVSQIKPEELTAYPAPDVSQALQGRAAGVQVQSANGAPGASPRIRVRGSTSINASSDPIYVVDGFVNGAVPPPEDVASVEVLKDAAATAIYGSRGANGVIIITTKRGKIGKPVINLNSSYSFQEDINRLDLLNADQYVNYVQEVVPDYESSGFDTDWQDEIYRPGAIQNYQLSISGGSENVGYYISGTFFDQKGVIVNSDFQRYSITSNIDVQASERLKVGLNLFARRQNTDGVVTQEGSGGSGNQGVVSSAYLFDPDQGIFNPDGTYTTSKIGDQFNNPYATATQRTDQNQTDRVQANLLAEYSIFDNLTFTLTAGASSDNGRRGRYIPSTLVAGQNIGGLGLVNGRKFTSLLNENYFTYSNEFGIHSLQTVVGYSFQQERTESWESGNRGFVTNNALYWDVDGGTNPTIPQSGLDISEIVSWYGRINYRLLDRYLLTLNARVDGSSTFSKNNKYAFFPSGAIGWNVNEEAFLEDVAWLDGWKLRASYGLTGNRAIGPYQTLARFEPLISVQNGALVNAVRPTELSNDNLTWETTRQLNVGTDVSLFAGRANLTVDYYTMETRDLLFQVELDEFSGYPEQLQNLGRTQNKGLEVALDLRNRFSAFDWDINLNFSTNENTVLALPDGLDILYGTGPGHFAGLDNTQILREGQTPGSFFGFIYDGVYQEGDEFLEGGGFEQEPGGERFRDINGRDEEGNLTGMPDGQLNNDDQTIIGDPNPDYIWGVTNTFRYKGFDLNIFFQASQGNDILNYTLLELNRLAGSVNATTEALDRWTPTNTNTNVPRATAGRTQRVSSRFVYDGSYVRLKNLALGYNFAGDLLDRINISNLRLYVSAQNLLTFTDYPGVDPEVSYNTDNSREENRNRGLDYGSYPNVKSYTVGLNIQF